jgi:hypothetical protein
MTNMKLLIFLTLMIASMTQAQSVSVAEQLAGLRSSNRTVEGCKILRAFGEVDSICRALLSRSETEDAKRTKIREFQILYPLIETNLTLSGRGFLNRKTGEYFGVSCITVECNIFRFVYFRTQKEAFYYGLPFTFRKDLESDSIVYFRSEDLKAHLKSKQEDAQMVTLPLDLVTNLFDSVSRGVNSNDFVYKNGWNWSSNPITVGNSHFIHVLAYSSRDVFDHSRSELKCLDQLR